MLLEFLRKNALSQVGVADCIANFSIALHNGSEWIGCAGFELYGDNCLLRSVAVDKRYRGQGYGTVLVEATLKLAISKGANRAYLLTENAASFFERLGFDVMNRDDVDERVKASIEFSELCPETAVVMSRRLV